MTSQGNKSERWRKFESGACSNPQLDAISAAFLAISALLKLTIASLLVMISLKPGVK